jgi:hypothetical protein
MIKQIRQALCRHDFVRAYEHDRIFQVCSNCGKQTPGITVTPGKLQFKRAERKPFRVRRVA